MKRLSLLAFVSAVLWAQTSGVRPRPSPNSYPAKDHVRNATIAAVVLSPAQVKSAFGSDTYKGYIVMEVAVFPDPSGSIKVIPRDFMLKVVATGDFLRPSAPSTIALMIDEKNNPSRAPIIPSKIDIVTTSTIGYDSAGTYNPNTGKRQSTVYTGTEVTVAPGGTLARNPQPKSGNGRSFDDMEGELTAKALPEVTTSQPVAGYLYFIPSKKKASGSYELDYSGDAGHGKLSVPPPTH